MGHVNDLFDFTVSMFVLHPTESKIALHWHEKLKMRINFGGHIELDEDPLECLEKEMLEETGLKPDEYEIVETHDTPKSIGAKDLPSPFGLHMWKYGNLDHWHIDMPYIIKSKKKTLTPQEGESKEVGWYSIEEIRELFSEDQLDDDTVKICEWIHTKYF